MMRTNSLIFHEVIVGLFSDSSHSQQFSENKQLLMARQTHSSENNTI